MAADVETVGVAGDGGRVHPDLALADDLDDVEDVEVDADGEAQDKARVVVEVDPGEAGRLDAQRTERQRHVEGDRELAAVDRDLDRAGCRDQAKYVDLAADREREARRNRQLGVARQVCRVSDLFGPRGRGEREERAGGERQADTATEPGVCRRVRAVASARRPKAHAAVDRHAVLVDLEREDRVRDGPDPLEPQRRVARDEEEEGWRGLELEYEVALEVHQVARHEKVAMELQEQAVGDGHLAEDQVAARVQGQLVGVRVGAVRGAGRLVCARLERRDLEARDRLDEEVDLEQEEAVELDSGDHARVERQRHPADDAGVDHARVRRIGGVDAEVDRP